LDERGAESVATTDDGVADAPVCAPCAAPAEAACANASVADEAFNQPVGMQHSGVFERCAGGMEAVLQSVHWLVNADQRPQARAAAAQPACPPPAPGRSPLWVPGDRVVGGVGRRSSQAIPEL
jgi:hypothetical protein